MMTTKPKYEVYVKSIFLKLRLQYFLNNLNCQIDRSTTGTHFSGVPFLSSKIGQNTLKSTGWENVKVGCTYLKNFLEVPYRHFETTLHNIMMMYYMQISKKNILKSLFKKLKNRSKTCCFTTGFEIFFSNLKSYHKKCA